MRMICSIVIGRIQGARNQTTSPSHFSKSHESAYTTNGSDDVVVFKMGFGLSLSRAMNQRCGLDDGGLSSVSESGCS